MPDIKTIKLEKKKRLIQTLDMIDHKRHSSENHYLAIGQQHQTGLKQHKKITESGSHILLLALLATFRTQDQIERALYSLPMQTTDRFDELE